MKGYNVSFPGLGLDFTFDGNAIENCFGIEGFHIKWYGVIITTGILLAFLLFYRLATKYELLDPDSIFNVTLIILPVAIIGARLVYVLTKWDSFKGKGFLYMINIRNGGIAIYGAIIFGLLAVLIYNKIKKQSSFAMLDALAPAVMLGQVIGRWGNFANAEAYGWSEGVDNLPWRMMLDRYVIDGKVNPPEVTSVHPTFLYESLWNLLGLAIIVFILYRKKKFNGEIFFAYLGWYGLGRAYIETLRADSLYIVGNLKFSVFVGIVCVIVSIIGLIVLSRIYKEQKIEASDYKPAFESIRIALSEQENNESSYSESQSEETDEEHGEEFDEELDEEDTEVLKEQDLLDGDSETESEEKTDEE